MGSGDEKASSIAQDEKQTFALVRIRRRVRVGDQVSKIQAVIIIKTKESKMTARFGAAGDEERNERQPCSMHVIAKPRTKSTHCKVMTTSFRRP